VVEIAVDTRRASARLPSCSWGYVAAACFLVVELAESVLQPDSDWRDISPQTDPLAFAIGIIAAVYFLSCIYRIHRVLADVTNGAHPVGPVKAVGFLLIPIFSLYWVFAFTNRLAEFVNAQGRTRMAKGWTGAALLVAILLLRVDGALGIAAEFAVLQYITAKLRRSLPAANG